MQVHHQLDRGCTVLSPVLRTCGSGTMPSLFYLLWIFFLLWFVCVLDQEDQRSVLLSIIT